MYRNLSLSIFILANTTGLLVSEANASTSIAITACKCEWKLLSGESENNKNDSTQLGVNIKFKLNAMYLGIEYQTSKTIFDNPIQIDGNTQQDLDATEIDLSLGYYINRHVATFIGYKKLELDYGSSLESTAPGIGVLGKYTLTNNWLVFANAAHYFGDLSQSGNNGDTNITNLVAGTTLRLSLYSHLDLSYVVQQLNLKRSKASDIEFEKSGITLSYNYVF